MRTPSRRSVLRSTTAATTAGLLTFTNTSAQEPRSALTQQIRDAFTPAQILQKAKDGNRRYLEGREIHWDFRAEQRATAAAQYPAAVVLCCIDSRVPAEIIFNVGIGDIFNCRIAGNIENADVLGSLEFATKLEGAKLVLVMGHSGCGAVKGAISDAKLGNLTQLLAKIQPAIKAAAYTGKRTADNPAFVDAVVRKNIELTIANIRRKSAVIAELERSGAVKIVGAFDDLATGAVEFMG
jgi:carbonic anhydrase